MKCSVKTIKVRKGVEVEGNKINETNRIQQQQQQRLDINNHFTHQSSKRQRPPKCIKKPDSNIECLKQTKKTNLDRDYERMARGHVNSNAVH